MIILIIHIIVSCDQNISLIFYLKMDPMSGCDIRLVFTFPPKDSTLQYKNCVHLWNNFPSISTLCQFNFLTLWSSIITYHPIFNVNISKGNNGVSEVSRREPLLLDKNNQKKFIAWEQYSRQQIYYWHGQNYWFLK